MSAKKLLKGLVILGLDLSEFEKPIDELCAYLQDLVKSHPDYQNHHVELSGCYDDVSMNLVGDRLETDNELRIRLERADRYYCEKQLRLLSKGQVKLTQELVEKCKTDKWKRKLAEAAIKGRVARM